MSYSGIIISIIVISVFVIWLINGTSLFYKEDSSYTESDISKIMNDRAKPIISIHGKDKAILFIHGFPSTPATYEYVAHQAENAGYDIIAPLLPGCGTTPDDIISKTFSQWYAFVRDIYLSYRKSYDNFFIAGSSMGGSLCLRLAEEFSSSRELAPTAVFIASTPVFLNSIRNRMLRSPFLYIVRIVGWFTGYIPTRRKNDIFEDGEERWIGYKGIFPRQLFSLMRALHPIRHDLSKITVPLCAIHSKGDKTTSFKNLKYIINHVSSNVKRIKEYDLTNFNHSRHTLFLYDSTRDDIFTEMHNFFSRIEKTQNR